MVPWVGLQYLIVVFPDHTHLLFEMLQLHFNFATKNDIIVIYLIVPLILLESLFRPKLTISFAQPSMKMSIRIAAEYKNVKSTRIPRQKQSPPKIRRIFNSARRHANKA